MADSQRQAKSSSKDELNAFKTTNSPDWQPPEQKRGFPELDQLINWFNINVVLSNLVKKNLKQRITAVYYSWNRHNFLIWKASEVSKSWALILLQFTEVNKNGRIAYLVKCWLFKNEADFNPQNTHETGVGEMTLWLRALADLAVYSSLSANTHMVTDRHYNSDS